MHFLYNIKNMTMHCGIIFWFAILFGTCISFGKCENNQTDLTENDNFQKFFSENLYGKTFVVIVDVPHVNLNKVKKFLKQYNVPSDNQIVFGIINGSGFAVSNNFISAKKMMKRIQLLEPSTNTQPSGKDLFQTLETTLSTIPYNLDVLFFTQRPITEKPLHQILFDKLSEKHIRVFVIWTGDSAQNMDAMRSIAQSSNGSLQFLFNFVTVENYDKEITNLQLSETSGLQKSAHEEDIDNFNRMENTEKRFREERFSGEDDEEGNMRPKLAEIRFPETNPLEEMANNFLGRNTSSENQISKANFFIPVKVEVSSTSSLECLPGSNHRMTFDVMNNLPTSLSLNFYVINIQNLRLVNIQPHRQILTPMEEITVDVFLQAPSSEINSTGHITFLAVTDDNRRTIRESLIYITNKISTDSYGPKINYSYKGDCKGHDKPDTCGNAHWSVEATIYDEESGLKKILSEPYGLLFKQLFKAGTKSQTTVYYSASCCQSKVEIYAEDGKGNSMKRLLDINNQGLLTGEIAAIVVGVLLLIFIVIAIIVAIVLIRRRNKSKLIIPRYQSSSNSS